MGNLAFAAAYARRHLRFVNDRDLIPNFPLPGLLNRYRHVGELYWFDSEGLLDVKGRIEWFAREALALAAMEEAMTDRTSDEVMARFIEIGIRDHEIGQYVTCLRKNLPPE